MDREKYEKIFVQESERYLDELDEQLLDVELELENNELWGDIHGKIHSIKGMARALSFDRIVELTHLMEDWCKQFQEGSAKASESSHQALMNGTDLLRHLVLQKGTPLNHQNQNKLNTLQALFKKAPNQASEEQKEENRYPESGKKYQVRRIGEVRVKYALIEELMGLSQEIQTFEKTIPPLPVQESVVGLKSWIDGCMSLMRIVNFRMAHLRLMAVQDFIDLFLKPVRNLAKECGKQIRMEVKGGEIEADVTLLERLREPLMHVFRNSVAHGIETPEERVSGGKEPEGIIRVEVTRDRERLVMQISDDGRGIDKASIIEFLMKRRGLSSDAVSIMSDREIFSVILEPDFSSASRTTDMAGRGVGMNVVAQAIDYLGGRLEILSEPGKGTTFDIRLPVSLSVIYAVTFTVGPYSFSVPTSRVSSIDILSQLRDEDADCRWDLRRILEPLNGRPAFYHGILISLEDTPASEIRERKPPLLIVDRVVGNRPLMVLPVGELLSELGIYSGIGILENGDISLLLDLERLEKRFSKRGLTAEGRASSRSGVTMPRQAE